jgi:hypothetical protein
MDLAAITAHIPRGGDYRGYVRHGKLEIEAKTSAVMPSAATTAKTVAATPAKRLAERQKKGEMATPTHPL